MNEKKKSVKQLHLTKVRLLDVGRPSRMERWSSKQKREGG
jgi:hypothetical protein